MAVKIKESPITCLIGGLPRGLSPRYSVLWHKARGVFNRDLLGGLIEISGPTGPVISIISSTSRMPKKQKITTHNLPIANQEVQAISTDKFWASPVVIPPKANPGQGKHYLLAKIKAYSPMWWDSFHLMMEGDDNDMKKVAFQEFNKLQQKLMPQQLAVESESMTAVGVIMLPKKIVPSVSESESRIITLSEQETSAPLLTPPLPLEEPEPVPEIPEEEIQEVAQSVAHLIAKHSTPLPEKLIEDYAD